MEPGMRMLREMNQRIIIRITFKNHRGRRRWSFSLTPTFWPWEKKQSSEKRAFYRFTHHPTLWSAEMPMHKGFERSVGWSWPYTHPTLTLHSDVTTTNVSRMLNYKITDRESQARCFSAGSKLWVRRLRTCSPCPSDWWFVWIASIDSLNAFLFFWQMEVLIKQILTRFSGEKLANRNFILYLCILKNRPWKT